MVMNLRHMEVFRAVYDAGSISLGAQALNISQPSVSRMVRHIEDQLGYALFRLHKGRITATPEADRLFLEIDDMFDRVEQVREVARSIGRGHDELLAVVANHSFAASAVPSALRRTSLRFPELRLSLNVQNYREQLRAVATGNASIGIAGNVTPQPGIQSQIVGNGAFVALVPSAHALAKQHEIPLQAFGEVDSVLPLVTSPWGRVIFEALQAQDVTPRVRMVLHAPHLCAQLVETFDAIAIVDDLTAEGMRGFKGVVPRALASRLSYQVSAFWSASRPLSRANTFFIDQLSKEFSQRRPALCHH